ncbi:hypothetical protein Tco_1369118, partial [Tanacetum coccineum]
MKLVTLTLLFIVEALEVEATYGLSTSGVSLSLSLSKSSSSVMQLMSLVKNSTTTILFSKGSELGSALTSLLGSELDLASYRLIEDYFLATCEQELCPFNFLLASCQVSSSELLPRVEGSELQVFEDLYTSELGKETLPIIFLASELSSLYPASYRVASYGLLDFWTKTDFESWQQRIRLYYRGKENGVDILNSIDEGPFQMGTTRDTLTEGTEGAQQLGPEQARVYSDLSLEDKD